MPKKTKTAKPTKFEQTHITMVVDRSGSMSCCAAETIAAVNNYLADARKDANLKEADFELTIFDNQSIDTVRTGAPANVTDITGADFVPRGYTPLYDAIGRGIDSLDDRCAKSGSGKAVLVIVTDGQENASKKFTHGRIQELVTARQAAGWLVVFLGAGLDAAIQGAAIGVAAGTMASFTTDAAAMQSLSRSVYSMNSQYAANATASDARKFMMRGGANLTASARASMGDQTTQKQPLGGSLGSLGSKGSLGSQRGSLGSLGRARGPLTMALPKAPAPKADTWTSDPVSKDDAWGA